MLAPRYIQDELKAINSQYFAVYANGPWLCHDDETGARKIDRRGRWLIRKWKSSMPINQRLDSWTYNSDHILTIRKESDTGYDIGYEDLDRRAIKAIQIGLYNARRAKELAIEVDKHNHELVQKAQEEDDYIFRYAAKRIWHFYQEPTVIMGS